MDHAKMATARIRANVRQVIPAKTAKQTLTTARERTAVTASAKTASTSTRANVKRGGREPIANPESLPSRLIKGKRAQQ